MSATPFHNLKIMTKLSAQQFITAKLVNRCLYMCPEAQLLHKVFKVNIGTGTAKINRNVDHQTFSLQLSLDHCVDH